MSIVAIKKNPSASDLFWFGALMPLFFGLLGGWLTWRFSAFGAACGIWSSGAALWIVYTALPRLRRPIYVGWMYAVAPLGWVVTVLVLSTVFYLVVTPCGWLMRLFSPDPLRRQFDRHARSYWLPREDHGDRSRYFRQF